MMEQGTEEEVFEVYKILARRKTRKGNLEYLVRWKNYGEEDDTWEPIENLQDCDEVLNDFNERLSKGDALHFEQSPKKHRRFQRVTDSPSRDSNASSRGSTPPRTRAILNGPELHRHDQQSRDEGGSLKLASNPEDVSSMMKKRSPNYLKPKTGPKWEFLSISPKLPVDGDHVKKRYHQNSHIKQLFPGDYEREEEEQDIFLSTSPDGETQDSYGSLSNGYNSDIYIPAKRMKKSHSVIGTPLQTMEVSNGNVVIVTGRERMVSVSGIQGKKVFKAVHNMFNFSYCPICAS
ncbi:putative chromodomain Y-like protein [Apostichopus japonicus]|uniref:Putative chromodomain Y-like protein n=1 Tax=Stichopus japonicus TaxID=307972 RepID=A0A2G8KZ33_STIJA|nr:putative chromodomain Y-like protein [Apostichopus japonicus]